MNDLFHLFASSRFSAWLLTGAMVVLVALFGIVIRWILMLRLRVFGSDSRIIAQEKTLAELKGQIETQAVAARQMAIDLEHLRKQLVQQEEAMQPEPWSWSAAGAPLNLNRRGQILRLSRKGKSISEIARDLNVAQGEVQLILKVHDLSQQSAGQEI